jgi:hypothetical protein
MTRRTDVSLRVKQTAAFVLAVSAALVGGWASVDPHSWYSTFPGMGHHWVRSLGPYNDHLTRDVGGLYLALLVVSVWALVRGTTELLRLAGVAWLAFSIPHLAFHLDHLDGLTTFDKVGNVVALGGTLILAAVLTFPTRTRSDFATD